MYVWYDASTNEMHLFDDDEDIWLKAFGKNATLIYICEL